MNDCIIFFIYNDFFNNINMKTREQIILDMCFTMRHDYGLDKSYDGYSFEAGMTEREREMLFNQMAQIFDNCIAPHMSFKDKSSF